jgi:hypothetical protein
MVVGRYIVAHGGGSYSYGVIETLADGTWTPKTAAPVGKYPASGLNGIACSAVGTCVAVGFYASTSGLELLVENLSGKNWSAAQPSLPKNASTRPEGVLDQVTCTTAKSCVAIGYYTDSSSDPEGLIESLNGKRWTSIEAPKPGNAIASTQVGPSLFSVVCAAEGMCVSVGSYTDSGGNRQALTENLSDGNWTDNEATLPANAATTSTTGPAPYLSSAACPAVGACVAVGQYDDTSGAYQGLIEAQAGVQLSPNYSGFAATGGGTYNRAEGEFIVPDAVCGSGITSEVSIWVGIGGQTSQDATALVQNGIEYDCAKGKSSGWYAFWENNPTNENSRGGPTSSEFPLATGDAIEVVTTIQGSNAFYSFVNLTQGADFSSTAQAIQTIVPTSSAECILEAPSRSSKGKRTTYPLTDFGTAEISTCQSWTTTSSTSCSMPSAPSCEDGSTTTPIDMTTLNYGDLRAQVIWPTTDGSAFDIVWKEANP